MAKKSGKTRGQKTPSGTRKGAGKRAAAARKGAKRKAAGTRTAKGKAAKKKAANPARAGKVKRRASGASSRKAAPAAKRKSTARRPSVKRATARQSAARRVGGKRPLHGQVLDLLLLRVARQSRGGKRSIDLRVLVVPEARVPAPFRMEERMRSRIERRPREVAVDVEGRLARHFGVVARERNALDLDVEAGRAGELLQRHAEPLADRAPDRHDQRHLHPVAVPCLCEKPPRRGSSSSTRRWMP